ncbi:Transcriptional regulator [Fructobacillus tropaeoli]|uniref:helix-turn-helix domain-containing protein n=1 Tax=Fructobacillus tropaeoli TaxID=709323 RepID=UPI002D8338C2|nr:Transcriptional regulator [Fructobacillus tropaeoli]
MENNRIKRLREEKNIGIQALSEKLNIPQSTLTRYETNFIKKGKMPIWQKLADFFGVSVGYIQGISDIKNPFDSNNVEELFDNTLGYMADVGPQIFDEEKNKYDQVKNSKRLVPILGLLSKNESFPDDDEQINYEEEIQGEKKRSNIYKSLSALAELGRSTSPEAEQDIQKITDILEILENRTQLPPELGGYENSLDDKQK